MLPKLIKHHILEYERELPEPWPYDYVLDGFGVVKRCNTPQFMAALRVAWGQVAGLPVLLDPQDDLALVLRLPRIPAKWLVRVLDHARRATPGNSQVVLRPVEQMYHFHYFESDGWKVAVPQQNATAGRVSYRGGAEASVVLDLHSHHQMKAYFSDTDNRDEQGCRFYGVIGQIYDQPELRLRLGVYGDFVEVDPTLLFAGLGPFKKTGEFR